MPRPWRHARRHAGPVVGAAPLVLAADRCLAHATEQSFVLLLPTKLYIASGVAAVILTLLLLALPRIGTLTARWKGHPLASLPKGNLAVATSTLSFVLLVLLLHAGFAGSADPLENPLPLFVWTGWWIVLVILQAIAGDLWRWTNPWLGPYRILRRATGIAPIARLPRKLGALPATALFILFALFMVADLAPTDPRRLAAIVAGYALFTLAGMFVFGGRAWLARSEFITVFMRRIALLAPFSSARRTLLAGLPGWHLAASRRVGPGLGLFCLAMLAAGSFESLYATFFWLSAIGINPLEFPGRSAVFWQSTAGLILSFALVAAAFTAVVAIGLALVGARDRFGEAFRRQAQCVLPIVAGYHVAHYLTALMVDGQYLLAALSDPLATGADLLGLGQFHVTTGFLNTRDSVRAIWLTQAGAVVTGHILAILASHAVAFDMLGQHRKATLSQLPISVFMVAYTFFGLWLLASPRGM